MRTCRTTPEIFQKAQQLLLTRKKAYGKRKTYLLTRMLYCAECGSCLYRRVTKTGIQWVCSKHLHNLEQCGSQGILEDVVYEKFLILLHKLAENREALLNEYLKQLEKVRDQSQIYHPDMMELNRQIALLNGQNHTLHHLWARSCIDPGFFIAQINQIEQKYHQFQEELRRCRRDNAYDGIIQETKQLISLVSQPLSESFAPEALQKSVSRILISERTLVFQMKNGLDLTESREG